MILVFLAIESNLRLARRALTVRRAFALHNLSRSHAADRRRSPASPLHCDAALQDGDPNRPSPLNTHANALLDPQHRLPESPARPDPHTTSIANRDKKTLLPSFPFQQTCHASSPTPLRRCKPRSRRCLVFFSHMISRYMSRG